ncbi:MAG: GAF domain-containing protein, partial [Deltaproteobacteria bacterium]|nr:GAF domain-containing protein [Deltaproteobacteria bacterium]
MFSRNLSVSKQVALRIVLLGLIIATFVFSFLIPIQIRLDRKHAIEHADLVADAISSAYNVLDRPEELDSISQLLIDAAGSSDVAWVRIVGHDNEILYGTDPEYMKRDESYLQGEKQIGAMLYVTRKIAVSHSPVQAIEVAMDLSIIQAESKLLFAKLIFAVLALLALLALFIGRMTHKLVGKRLQKLVTAMGNAEKGSFLVRAQVDRIDEVGLLAIAFNKLLAALTRMQVKEIEWEHDLQEAHEQLSIKDQLERANKSLKRRIKAQELLTEASQHLGGVLNKNTLVQRLVDLLKNKLGWSDFGIFLLTPESTLRMQIASGFLDTPFFEHLEFQFGEGVTGIAAESKKPLFIPDIEKDTRVLFKDRPELPRGSTLAIPMLYQERVIGVMTFFRQEPSAFDEQDINMLDTLGAFIS